MDINKFIEFSGEKRGKLVIPVRKFFKTDGNGHWSNVAKRVFVQRMEIEFDLEDPDFVDDFKIFFSKSWDIGRDGLIYTDDTFETCIRDFLKGLGLYEYIAYDISYSEQGMQSRNYVSCDAYELEKYIRYVLTNASSHTSGTS
jgi:hypothetical protein